MKIFMSKRGKGCRHRGIYRQRKVPMSSKKLRMRQ